MAYPGSLGATSDALNDFYNIGKYKPKPKPVVDPTTQSNSQIAALLDSIAQGPDYSGVNLDPYGAADATAQGQGYKDAKAWAEARIDAKLQPFKDSYKSDQELLNSQRKLSTDASNNFNAAFAGILTGGKSGAEGQAYAKEHFGGSYMGDIAAEDGMVMLGQLTRDFNARDWELKDKLDKVLAQRPDLVDQLYQDVVNTEVENSKNGIAMADSSWDHRLKAATLITNILQKQEAEKGRTDRNNADNLTKVITAAKQSGMTIRSGKNGAIWGIDAAGNATELVPGQATPAKQKIETVTLANGQKQKVVNGSPVGKPYGPAKTTKATAKDLSKVKATARSDAITLGRSYWTQKGGHPDMATAANTLWQAYGMAMVEAGVQPKSAALIIQQALKAASGGQWRWNPNSPLGKRIIAGTYTEPPVIVGGGPGGNPFMGG